MSVFENIAFGLRAKSRAERPKQAQIREKVHALLDLIQRVQLEAGQADVSMVASFNLAARVSPGPVTVREIYDLYHYENTLVVVELTGRQLKAALEHSARYFRPYEPGRTPAELIDDKIPGYNFDIAEGVCEQGSFTEAVDKNGNAIFAPIKFHNGVPVGSDSK